MIVMVRDDVFEKWGWPEPVMDESQTRLRLEDVMLHGSDERLQSLWLQGCDGKVEWNGKQEGPFTEEDRASPMVVAEVDGGGWGKRVYMHMVPATKASSWGISGMTHLVAQMRNGKWSARRLHKEELRKVFESDRVQLKLAGDDDEAVGEMGNAGPARMVHPHADGIAKWGGPPSSFVPERIDEIVPVAAVEAVRGTMATMAFDFDERVKGK